MTTLTTKGRPISLPVISPRAKGIILAFAAAVISGFSIWVNSYAVKEVRDPAVFATAKNVTVGAAFLAILLLSRRPQTRRREKISRKHVAGLLLIGLIGGSIPFVLFFEGLAAAGPGNGAFIQKSLFIWVAILAVPLLSERVTLWHLFALAMLGIAQWFIGHPAAFTFGQGELMVLAATLFWAAEVILARRLLPSVGASVGATARMAFGGIILLAYLASTGKLDDLAGLSVLQWQWVLGTAAILFCYVSAWYGALRFAPATVVTSVLALGAPITAFLSTAASGKPAPGSEQLAGYVLIVLASALLIAATARMPREASVREAA